MTEPRTRRVFFALWPDAAALDALEAAADQGLGCCGGRRMRRDSLHLTLAFIGVATPEQVSQLQSLAEGIAAAPYDIVLDRLGYWRHNRILWAGCQDAPSGQRRLFAALDEALAAAGFAVDPRPHVPHVPHVTLVRNARCDELPRLAQPIAWPVREFSLVESALQPEGARYRVMTRWPLRESA